MKVKKMAALILAMAMTVCALGGCASGDGAADTKAAETKAAENKGTVDAGRNGGASGDGVVSSGERKVVIGESTDPETLAPYAPLYADRYALLCMIYQPLMIVAGNQQYNVMFSSMDEPSDGVYEIHLYEDIYDTAGNPFTADDVVFSYGLAQESGNFSKLGAVKSIEAVDDYTVRFTFDDTMIFGQINAVLSQIFMVTKASYEASPDKMATSAVGTTGYVVSQYTEGSSIQFTRSEKGYWQKAVQGTDGYVPFYDDTKLDIVEYDFISESSQMAIALQSGAIDIADRISSTDVGLFQEGGESANTVNIHEVIGEFYTATFNCAEESACNNENMRKALAYSWDTKGIIEGAFNGAGEVATALNNHYRLDYNPEYDTRDYFGYNPDLAKDYLNRYLTESGKKPSDVNITILVSNNEYLEKVAQIMQAYVLQLGIGCKVASYDNVTRKTIRNSREGWDIAVAKDTATNQYFVDTMSMQFNRETGKSLAGGWIDDDELHALMLAGVSPKTHSVETVSAFEDFMMEHCFAAGVCIDVAYMGCNNRVTDLVTGPYDVVSPCACTYEW